MMQQEKARSTLERTVPTGRFILIVGDNDVIRGPMVRELSRAGSVVAIAGDGRQAQDALDRQVFDLIFLDSGLPDMRAVDLLRIIRQRYTMTEVPVIAVASAPVRETIAECLRAGANDFITQPLEPGGLTRCVETHLRARRSRTAREWHRNAMALGTLESLSATVLETIGERISVWDSDDRLVACNRRYRELFDQNADEVAPGASFERLATLLAHSGLLRSAAEEPDAWLAGWLARHRDSGAPFEVEFADGRWARITEHPTDRGQTIGVWVDITDVKRRELAIRAFAETNRLLAAAINSANSAILITDARRRGNPTIFANPAFSDLTGWPVEEALGRDRRFLGGPGASALELARFEEKMAAGLPFTMDLHLRTRIGRSIWVKVDASPIRGRGDRIANWVIMQTDKSTRSRAEQRPGQPLSIASPRMPTGDQARDLINLLGKTADNAGSVLDGDAVSDGSLRARHDARPAGKPEIRCRAPLSREQAVILIVDQEPQVRAIASIQLRRLGYEVLQAEGGLEALDLIESRHAIDLLVTDLDLSGDMTGLELAASVRGRNPDVRVLYVSGYADGGWGDADRPAFRAPFLPKPYDSAALALAVRTALHNA